MLLEKTVLCGCFFHLVTSAFVDTYDNHTTTNDKFLGIHGRRFEMNTHYHDPNPRLAKRNHYHGDSSGGILRSQLDFVKLGFYADVQIGSQQDHVKMLIDTGSSDFWIPSTGMCNAQTKDNDEFSYDCAKFGSFDPSNSTSFMYNNTDFLVSYGDGAVSMGEFGQDSVVFNGVTLDNVNIAIANFSNTTSGILGIGYQATESTNFEYGLHREPFNYTNFPQHLVNSGIINKPVYSLFLDQQNDAEILFGAIDHDQYQGDLFGFPIVPMNGDEETDTITRIAITLNGIAINDGTTEYHIGEGHIPVVLDTGTTTAAFPYDLAMSMGNLLGLAYDDEMEYFYGSCDNIQNQYFKFNFQGIEFTSPLASYFLEVKRTDEYSEGCVFQIYMNNHDFVILGDSFLRDMYTVIDLEDNIAALAYRQNTDSNDIEVIDGAISRLVSPPNSQTYGVGYSQFTNYGTDVTKSFIPTPTTLSLNTAFATIYIEEEYKDEIPYESEDDILNAYVYDIGITEVFHKHDITTITVSTSETTQTNTIPVSSNAVASLTNKHFTITSIIALTLSLLI